MWRVVPGLTLGVAVLWLLVFASAGLAQQDAGSAIFQRECAGCHQPDGSGVPGAFPPLAGNPNATDPSYVADVVRNGRQGPIEVAGQTFDAVMPPVVGLTDAEIEEVASYVASLAEGGAPTTPTTTPGPVEGDPALGEELFVGGTALEEGGPACVACHAAGSRGRIGLGPDLTGVFDRLGGEAGLQAWLAAPPSPTMQPIFSDRPLTDGEIAHLTAYLGDISGLPPDRGADPLVLGGLGGLVMLFALMIFLARGPRGTYVETLRSRT